MRAGQLNDPIERSRIVDGQFAEHFSVQLDTCGHQGGDESVVADPALANRCAQSCDPELAEMPLFLPSIAVGVDAGLAGEFERLTVNRSRSADEALGSSKDPFSLAAVSRAACRAGHKSILSNGARGTGLETSQGPAWLHRQR